MLTRAYTLGSIMTSNTTPSSFTVDGVNYPFSISGTTDSTSALWQAMDSSTTSSWWWQGVRHGNVNGTYWTLSFSSLQELKKIDLIYNLRGDANSLHFEGNDGSSWVSLATIAGTGGSSATITINFPASTKYFGFRFHVTASTIDYFAIYNVEFYLSYNQQSIDFEGVLTDDISLGLAQVQEFSGVGIEDTDIADRNIRVNQGINIDTVDIGSRVHTDKVGLFTDDLMIGIRNRNIVGVLLDDVDVGVRSRNVIGVGLDDIFVSSQTSTKYILTVTPTHQHKNMPVTVTLTSRSTASISGKYLVMLNDFVVIQPASSDEAMNSVEFIINPSQLTVGTNKARIKLFYPDGTQEYLDFEIVKEETKRTVAQRLFRNYDGGFTGNGYAPPKILIPNIYPSWFATINSPTNLMKTTDYTRISLAHYTEMQGVSIVGSGLSILVSFDKGATWKSFINNVWTSVDIANIATYGMTVETINNITIAQWVDTFTPTSIDFAVYFNDNSLNNFYALETSPSIVLYEPTNLTIANSLTTTIQIPDGYIATKITSVDKGGSINPTYPVIRTIYSNMHSAGYAYEMPGSCVYPAQTGEHVSKVTFYRYRGASDIMVTIEGKPAKAYIKSITVNMTPSPFTGYAFII